ncbi:MAG: patatin-like phospholipase family protein [Microbacteriaceae bacterium]
MTVASIPYPAPQPLGTGVDRAIAFGGGGEWFTAWCLSYIHTLHEHGVDLSTAELTIGTSAGSVASAIVTAGVAEQAFAQWQQIAAHPEVLAEAVKVADPVPSQLRALGVIADATDTEPDTIREIGRAAMAAKNMPVADYEASITKMLGGMSAWPSPAYHTTAVDCYTGERLVADQNSGVTLAEAIAASSSLPGTSGPTWLGDRITMDGGVSHSSTHADVLVGAKRVIIFTLMSLTPEQVAAMPKTPFGMAEKAHPGNANTEKAMIEAAGGKALVVVGNPPAGINFMDPTLLTDAMARGAAQALADLDAVTEIWNG